jgi:putative transcriptional regulator
MNLSNQFLIAMPGMLAEPFAGSVILLCEHSEKGALGLVINRPTDLTLGTLFERIDLVLDNETLAKAPVYSGGPVQIDRGFVLHDRADGFASSIRVSDQLMLTTSRDVLQAVADGQGPARLLVTLGYAGWSAGQLEAELASNAWLTVAASPEVIFDIEPEARFDAAMRLLGFDPAMLASQAGHA